jgi:hypothetical protein
LWHQDGRVSREITGPGRLVKKEELEADIVGAYLAVPGATLVELVKAGYSAGQIGGILKVTPSMLQLRAEMMLAR